MKYNVGDLVKIKSDLKVGNNIDDLYVTDDMTNYNGKLVHITYAWCDNDDNHVRYHIDADNDRYFWSDDCFEDDGRCKYIIGYKKTEDSSVRTFEGYIDNFYPTGKSCFINDNDEILLLPYNLIEYIMPKKGNK